MAARLNPRHQEMIREKIRASQLVNVLEEHVLENRELSKSQVSAALGLLKKCIPDLQSTTLQNPDGSALNFTLSVPPKNGSLGPHAKAG